MNVLVVGGHGSIGSAIVEKFQKCGHNVKAPPHEDFDVAEEHSISSFFASTPPIFDVVVYATGINDPRGILLCDDEIIYRTFKINAAGFVSIARRCLPFMQKQLFGRIVAINSLYGIVSRKNRLPYAMSKHALTGAVQTLTLEFAQFGILTNAVSPGFIKTKMTEKNNSPDQIEELEKDIPIGRMGTGKDIAEIVEFLCSKNNTYITGQNIIVDGGYIVGGWQNA